MSAAMTITHLRRLREIWRSAGWPCQDLLEVELLAAGLLERLRDAQGHESLRVTDAGIAALAQTLAKNRKARDAHETLVERVALDMQRAGRIVWRGLSLRAPVTVAETNDMVAEPAADTRWVMAMPDVFSVRHSTREDLLEPIVHEIKVQRSDLLADLRLAHKREAYLALSSQCWYVLKAGIGDADDVPESCGVMLASPNGALEVRRPAPKRAMRLPLGTWIALARANALAALDDEAQAWLGEPSEASLGPVLGRPGAP